MYTLDKTHRKQKKQDPKNRCLPCIAVICIVAFVPLLISPALANKEKEKITAIQGGDLYTITSGIIHNGTILIKDGRIWQIGIDLPIPSDANTIDAKGKFVLPGLVAAKAQLGSYRTKKIADSLDPFHHSVSLALASGITTAFISYDDSNAVIKPTYADLDSMLIKDSVLCNIKFSNNRWVDKTNVLMALRKAKTYLQDLAQYNRDKAADKQATEPKKPNGFDKYLPLLRRETTTLINANFADDILAALELVDEFGIRMILDGAVEAWTVAEEIAKRDVAVIITPRFKQRPKEDISFPSGSNLENAAILKKAGVKFAIIPPSTSFSIGGIAGRDLMTLPMEAAFAVSGGLDEQTALEAITITPAELLGIADRVGSLQPGKDADIIILDGHPFHHNTFVQTTIINGKVLYEKDKSTYFSHIKHED